MSRLSQIRFALFLIVCAAIFALQVKRVLDIERPATTPEIRRYAADIYRYPKFVDLYIKIPAEDAKIFQLSDSTNNDDFVVRNLRLPVSCAAGITDDGKAECELKLYPAGMVVFSTLTESK